MAFSARGFTEPPLQLGAQLRYGYEQLWRAAYYRLCFGGSTRLARRWGDAVRRLEAELKSGDAPRPQSVWEAEYGKAAWRNLARLEELNRYSVIAGSIAFLKQNGSVLDVGCGEALLLSYLGENIGRYVGVDLAQAAIDRALRRHPAASFIQADAQIYVPDQCFDVIVFNEVLYYLVEPMAALVRYESRLAPGGFFIASLYEKSMRARAIRRKIGARYRSFCELRVSAHGKSWSIHMFGPKPPRRVCASLRRLLFSAKPKAPL